MNITINQAKRSANEYPAIKSMLNKGWRKAGFYEYQDENSNLLYCRIRLDPPIGSKEGKWLRPFSFDGKEWILKEPEFTQTKKPLYLLPRLKAIVNDIVYIVEGEKCADELTKVGITATTSGSAASANDANWSMLAGKQVIIWRDNDDAGLKYAKAVTEQLAKITCDIRWVDITRLHLKPKDDCVDWLASNPDATSVDIKNLPLIAPPNEALPTNNVNHTLSYPVELLPEIARNAVLEYQAYGQQPLPIVACSTLANMALACQGLANIARDEQLISPLSLFFIIIAESGERKTAADNHFKKTAKKWETQEIENLLPEIKKNKALQSAWQTERKSILNKIEKATDKHPSSIDSLKQHLIDLEQQEPSQLIVPNLYNEEITAEALAYTLANGWQSSSLWSDEAGIVIGGYGMNQDNATKFTSLLNRLWDGNTHRVSRRTSDSFTIDGRRLTCSLMMQPAVFEQLINRSNNVSRSNGFLARCLITNPVSSMGERLYKEPSSMPYTQIFNNTIERLLNKPLPLDNKQRLVPEILYLNPEAKKLWVNFHNEIEGELVTMGEFFSIKDFAAKAAENAARLAGVFHIFSGEAGNLVTLQTMQSAIGVLTWHLQETKRLLGQYKKSPAEQDAELLASWLTNKNCTEIKAADILQYAPSHLRNKERRDTAIKVLQQNNFLRIEDRAGIQFIVINQENQDAF